jgi:hypothetical protein
VVACNRPGPGGALTSTAKRGARTLRADGRPSTTGPDYEPWITRRAEVRPLSRRMRSSKITAALPAPETTPRDARRAANGYRRGASNLFARRNSGARLDPSAASARLPPRPSEPGGRPRESAGSLFRLPSRARGARTSPLPYFVRQMRRRGRAPLRAAGGPPARPGGRPGGPSVPTCQATGSIFATLSRLPANSGRDQFGAPSRATEAARPLGWRRLRPLGGRC